MIDGRTVVATNTPTKMSFSQNTTIYSIM